MVANSRPVPAEIRAARRQRAAHRLEATFLIVVLAAPLVQLAPAAPHERRYAAAAAGLLLAAVAMRLVLRRLEVDANWVRARRESEAARATELLRQVAMAGVDLPARWEAYRQDRIDDQLGYFTDRAGRHRRTARRWRVIRLVLTTATVGVAAAALLRPVPDAVVGAVAAAMAGSEAWLQFRRSEVLTVSFDAAAAELRALRARTPAGEHELAATVAAVEAVLERELWMWTAIMSVTVLASAPRSSTVDGPR
jgi:SMODS and SLOG-associating 2TM effector domain 1